MKDVSLHNWDPRLRWVVDRVLTYHNLLDEALAINMLERHGGRTTKRLFRIFAGADDIRVFYVYKTTYIKTFYKEVTVRKEGKKLRIILMHIMQSLKWVHREGD